MACCPSQPAPSMAASEPDLSVDGTVNSHPPQSDILAQDERQDVPGEEPVAEIDSGGGQDLSLRKRFLNLSSTTLQSGQDAQEESQVCRGNVRTFLPSSFKRQGFLSPILDLSPLSPLSGVVVHGKPNHEICASVIDEIQRFQYKTPLRGVEGQRLYFGKCGAAMDISMLEMESLPYTSWLDFTLESSRLQEFGSPDLEGRVKVNGGAEESSKKLEAEGAKESVRGHSASLCLNTQKGVVPLSMEKVLLLNSSGNVSGSSTAVLNGTTDLSHCEGSVRMQSGSSTAVLNGTTDLSHCEGSVRMQSGSTTSVLNGTTDLSHCEGSVRMQSGSTTSVLNGTTDLSHCEGSVRMQSGSTTSVLNGTTDLSHCEGSVRIQSGSSTAVLNGTTDLSHCEGSVRMQGLHEVKAGNITEAVPVGDPMTNEDSSTQASANATHVLHSGMTVSKSNLTFEFTEKCAVGPTAGGICMSGETEARPNLTVDIMDHGNAGSSLEDSAKSVELKNGTFDVPTPECESVAGCNLTKDLTTSEMGSAKKSVMPQNLTIKLHPGPCSESKAGLNFNATKQLSSEDDPTGVCDAIGGAEGQLASLTKVENCDSAYIQGLDVEDDGGASMWSLNSSLDMKANSLVTSTPLVVPKSFSFTKAAPSEVCKMLSVLDHSDVSDGDAVGNNPSAFPQVDQPPPAGAKPPAKSLTRSTGLPLKCGGKAQPSNKKLLACPSGIPNPKPLPTIPRPSSSHLSLAPPPKTAAGPQALGAASLLSSTLTRFRRQTGGALRNLAASGSQEASLGFTTGHRHSSVSENKPPVSGLHKPRTCSQLPPPSGSSLLRLRPTGQAASKLQTARPAAANRPLGLGDPQRKSPQSSTSSLKQPLRNAEETLPLSKKKKVDTLVHATSEPPGSPAGSQRGLRRPGSHLRGPQSKLQNLGMGRISGALATKKSGPKDPLTADVQPTAAQDAPPTAVSRPHEGDLGGAEAHGSDCEDCEKYRQENARLRADCEKYRQEITRLRAALQEQNRSHL